MSSGVRLARTCLGALVLLGPAAPALAAQPLRSEPVAAGYHLFYSGDKLGAIRRFERLSAEDPNDLPARFGLLFVEDQRLDADPTLAPAFEKALDAFIDVVDKRRDRNARDAEALLYAAQAYLLRGDYRFEHDKSEWGAIRDAARSKGLVESYLKLRPEDADAYLTLGLCNYYLGIAPAFVHFLRFLLFLPGGNRAEGLKQIERVAAQGTLLAPLAQAELVDIYASFEDRPAEALVEAERFTAQYPDNDDVTFALASLYAGPVMEDPARAGGLYDAVLTRRQGDDSPDGAAARATAVLGLAATEFDDWRCDEAVATLTAAIDARPHRPDWALPTLLLRRGLYRALIGDLNADADVRRVLDDPALAKWRTPATDLRAQIGARQHSGEAAVYEALIPANRLAAERQWDEARRAYEAVRAAHPNAPLVRYRIALLDFSDGQVDRARPAFEALASGSQVPDNIKAFSLLYIGRIDDLAGRREEAQKAYQKVVDNYGKQEEPVSYARVGLITAYRRPD